MRRFFKETLPEAIKVVKLQNRLAQYIPSPGERKEMLGRLRKISKSIACPHNESQPLSFIVDLFAASKDRKGCIVEAGSFKGGSTAKFSIAAKRLDRPLIVFDSFEGLPDNDEQHDKSILGHSIEGWFKKGEFSGSLEEVKENIEKYGEIEVCRFVKGWFDDTMPGWSDEILGVYLDVDLASSTRTCLKYLYPLIVPGGLVYSQDGDFPLVLEVFGDAEFWSEEVGCPKPEIEGFGHSKILKIQKPG